MCIFIGYSTTVVSQVHVNAFGRVSTNYMYLIDPLKIDAYMYMGVGLHHGTVLDTYAPIGGHCSFVSRNKNNYCYGYSAYLLLTGMECVIS